MKKIFISIVSHGHGELIKSINCISKLSRKFNVVLKLNKPENLSEYCRFNSIHLIDEKHGLGFGENNNIIYDYCCNELGMKDEDYFLVLNPDVYIHHEELTKLIDLAVNFDASISAINLFKDFNYRIYDDSIRKFPSFRHFLFSFLGLGNSTKINKSTIYDVTEVDWAAGSFLMFKSQVYSNLGGFDKRYFMYCEDIDICYRAKKNGYKVIYFPNIKATHLAQHKNRRVLSKHFVWHMKNSILFLLSK